MNQDRHKCTNGCFNQQDKTNQSRRSIDWRDSGIVIDEDDHMFRSFENVYTYDSKSSIRSEHESEQSRQQTQTGVSNPRSSIQSIASSQDQDGDTILHLAVVGLTLEQAKDLIGSCDLNAINNMMQTPLHVATLAKKPDMVRLLVSSGAKLDVHDRRGNTPLHLACQKGLIDIVEIIVDALPANTTENGVLNREQVIRLCNFEGFACFHLATMSNQNEIIELLVNKYQTDLSARDSKSGETILHKAIRHFNFDLVEFMLKHNHHSLINAADFSGRMPLHTIRILQGSSDMLNDQHDSYSKLLMIKQLIENSIQECVSREGCCIRRRERSKESLSLSDSAPSSSDCSDSDY